MINNIVNKVFVITTLHSNRCDYIDKHMDDKNISYEFFIAPDKEIVSSDIVVKDSGKDSRGALSLLSAFCSIIRIAELHKYKEIAIIEDDCYFGPKWKYNFCEFYNAIPYKWDILNLGYHPTHDTYAITEPVNEKVKRPMDAYHTTHCMLIKNTCYRQFLDIADHFKYSIPSDYVFNEIYKQKILNCYAPIEKIAYQLSTRADHKYAIPDIHNIPKFASLIS